MDKPKQPKIKPSLVLDHKPTGKEKPYERKNIFKGKENAIESPKSVFTDLISSPLALSEKGTTPKRTILQECPVNVSLSEKPSLVKRQLNFTSVSDQIPHAKKDFVSDPGKNVLARGIESSKKSDDGIKLLKRKKVLSESQDAVFSLPAGPWTKQLKYLPKYYSKTVIFDYFKKNHAKKHLHDGNRMMKADRAERVFLCPDNKRNTLFVKSVVVASYAAKEYKVQLHLKHPHGIILDSYCQCPCGINGVCKHISTVLFFLLDCKNSNLVYIRDDVSCTEGERQWGNRKPTNSKLKTKHFEKLKFVRFKLRDSSDDSQNHKRRSSCKVDLYESLPKLTGNEAVIEELNLKGRLEKFSSGFGDGRKMLKQIIMENQFKPTNLNLEVNKSPAKTRATKSVINREEIPFPNLISTGLTFPDNCLITLEQARELEVLTRDQGDKQSKHCQLWKSERQIRLTASKFGEVVKRRVVVTKKFVEYLKKGADLSSNSYVQEGLNNEDNAIEMYLEYKKGKVTTYKMGFCVNPSFPIVGASPDRLCFDESINGFGLIEIKTLSKAKKEGLTIEEAVNRKLAMCLKKEKTGEIKLKENHNYYYQVQGQMGVTGYKWCDFFIVTDTDFMCQRIKFDENLFHQSIVPKLTEFYFKHFVDNLRI